jgi:redox-sensing transcriptional repressor
MTVSAVMRAPEASVLRLSRYHCFVGELIHSGDTKRLTSSRIAAELGVSDEAVRRDLSYVDVEGRPGAGYAHRELYDALANFLDLSAGHPFAAVGNRRFLEGLSTVFPAETFGLRAVAYFSEDPEDFGRSIDGIQVRSLDDAAEVVSRLGVGIALVATAPEFVPDTLERLYAAGVGGALLLTPVLDTRHPEGMNVTFFRIPCTLKALAATHVDRAAEMKPTAPSCCCDGGSA